MMDRQKKENTWENERFLKSHIKTHDLSRDTPEPEDTTSLRRPARWKLNVFAMFSIFLGFGFANSTTGSTMVDMEEMLHTGTSGMAISVAAGNSGYLLGSILCGALYGRFQSEPQILFFSLFLGVTLSLSPWARNLVVYCILFSLASVAKGLIDAFAQGFILQQMAGHRLKNPALQLMQGLFSVGGTMGALTIKPFLRQDRPENETSRLYYNSSMPTVKTSEQPMLLNSVYQSNVTNVTTAASKPKLMVGYAFVTIGCITIASAVPMFLTWITGPKQCKIHKNVADKQVKLGGNESRIFRILLLTLLFFGLFFTVWANDLTFSFIPTFVIKYLGWPRQQGPLIASTLWGTSVFGIFIIVPISYIATPRQIITVCMSLAFIAISMLWALMNIHKAFVWLSVALVGLALPPFFGTLLLRAAQLLRIDGSALAVIMTGGSVGAILPSSFTGYLFEHVSPMWLVYQIFGALVLDIILYVIIEIVVHVYNKSQSFLNT